MNEIYSRCKSRRTKIGEFSGGEQEECTAVRYVDGTVENGCHDPCRFIMGKDGTAPTAND